jgi:hypothetical protein
MYSTGERQSARGKASLMLDKNATSTKGMDRLQEPNYILTINIQTLVSTDELRQMYARPVAIFHPDLPPKTSYKCAKCI